MDPQLMLGEPDFWNAPLPSNMYAVRDGYTRLNITLNILENQTAVRKQLSIEHLYRLEIECFRLVNNHRVGSAFCLAS